MNVVYLIGNGFDINAGLKTSSRDFINYVFDNKHSEKYSLYVDSINGIAENMSENKELWSDFELALGKYSDNFNDPDNENNVTNFFNSIDLMNLAFRDFLTEQENISKKWSIDESHNDRFIDALLNICSDGIFESERETFNKVYRNNEPITASIINFNYTTLIDRLILFSFEPDIDSSLANLSSYEKTVFYKDHIHIHGQIDDNTGCIIGVDNINQITNSKFWDEDTILNSLIKYKMNSRLNNFKDYQCKKIINDADIICVFGMSFGATDKSWWDVIGKKIEEDRNCLLVIADPCDYPLDSSPRPYVPPGKIEEIKNKFFSQAENLKNKYMKPGNVVVSFHTKFFDIFNDNNNL